MNATTPPRTALARGAATTGAVALALLALALVDGASGLTARSVSAIFVWWAVLLATAFSLWPVERVPRAAATAGGLLAAYTVLAGLSALWAPSAERAFLEFDRVALYLGLFVLAVLAAGRGTAARWADGLAAGIAIVGVLALCQRLLPGVMPETDIPRLLPSAGTRLSYPVGYWNGLSILLALGVAPLLRLAAASRPLAVRALAVAVLPAVASAMYLTSSRGGAFTLAVGAVVFFALTARRAPALQAAAVAAAGSLVAILVLRGHPALVDGTPGSPAAGEEGPEVAATVLAICIACGVVQAVAARWVPARVRVPRPVAAAAWAAAVVAAVALFAAADVPERFREFKAPPDPSVRTSVGEHLVSSSGSGRWQFWDSALAQFGEHPVAGQGAGSYEAWWAQHGSIDWFVRNAHSLWLETLGELGLVGFLLLAAACAIAIGTGMRRARAAEAEDDRAAAAALAAVAAAFVAGAALDWIWQIPAIAAVGVVALALLVGPATCGGGERARRPVRVRFGVRAAVVLAAWAALLAQAVPLLVDRELDASRDAAARGDLVEAEDRADSARSIQPWAASPRLQLALVRERAGDLASARRHAGAALERDRADWRLWVVEARLATKAGDVPRARAALREARRLNPRSPALRALGGR